MVKHPFKIVQVCHKWHVAVWYVYSNYRLQGCSSEKSAKNSLSTRRHQNSKLNIVSSPCHEAGGFHSNLDGSSVAHAIQLAVCPLLCAEIVKKENNRLWHAHTHTHTQNDKNTTKTHLARTDESPNRKWPATSVSLASTLRIICLSSLLWPSHWGPDKPAKIDRWA